MNFRKSLWLTAVFLMAVTLSACNMNTAAEPTQDVAAIQTQAIELVLTQSAMQQTQTAMAIPPSPMPTSTLPALATATLGTPSTFSPVVIGTPGTGTPFAFNTPATGFTALASPVPTSTDTCHKLEFITDVTVPDGTVLKPGVDFEKIWRVMNTGTCSWDDGYVLVYQGGKLDGYNVPLSRASDFVQPGETKDIGVRLTTSLTPDKYNECWRMKDDRGYYFGSFLCVVIEVKP